MEKLMNWNRFRDSSQKIIVEAFRRDINDTVSKIFVEAYDAAHPERIQLTNRRTFKDLIGTWKRTDGLLAEKSYNGQPPAFHILKAKR